MDISLPSTSASALWAGDKSGIGGVYLTLKVETLECAQAEGVGPPTFPAAATAGVVPEVAFFDFSRYANILRFTLVTSDGKRNP